MQKIEEQMLGFKKKAKQEQNKLDSEVKMRQGETRELTDEV